MQILIESIQELIELTSLMGGKLPVNLEGKQAKSEELKTDVKPVVEKPKKEKVETKKEEKADTKEETPKVEAEVTGVDTNTTEPPKDAEIKEENSDDGIEITKEMVREKFNAVVKSGKQKEAKQLIESLGVKKLSDVKPEDYATLIKEAEALL